MDNENIQNEQAAPETQSETKWWIDEATPGTGDRPPWLPEKFKSAQDMAKSYNELEKTIGRAPEKYDFTKSKKLDPNYKPFIELQELARSKRVPQEVMDKFQDSVDKYMSEFDTDFDEEMKKMGPDAKERIEVLNNWGKANLEESDFKALTRNLRDAESIVAFEKLRNKFMTGNSSIPNGNETQNAAPNMEDLQAELTNNLEKYKADPKYRKDIQSRIAAVGQQPGFVDKNY